jgi:hypothetical protein
VFITALKVNPPMLAACELATPIPREATKLTYWHKRFNIRKTHDFLFGAFASYFTCTKQIKCNFWKALPTCNKKSPLLFLYFFELLRQFSGETLFKSLLFKYLNII